MATTEHEVPVDDGVSQQEAELAALEQAAANEDYQPGPDEPLAGDHEAAEPEISTGELCTSLLSIGFNLVASRRGDHWRLSDGEAHETGQALGAVLDKYFPDLSNQGVEVTAVMTCAMVLTPRLMQDRKIEAQAAKREAIERQQASESAAEGGVDGDQS